MFTIEQIDPKMFRERTRKATFIIMAMFFTMGLPLAHFTRQIFSFTSIHPFVLNFSGALIGLMITFWIVKTFYIKKPWMAEAMYSWRLKRTLAKLYNIMQELKYRVEEDDQDAMKVLRFYHLAVGQMYNLENNSHANIELVAEKDELVKKMTLLGLDLNQVYIDDKIIDDYK